MDAVSLLGLAIWSLWAALVAPEAVPVESAPAPVVVAETTPTPAPVEAPAAPTEPATEPASFSGSYTVGNNIWTLTSSTFSSSANGITYPMIRNGNTYSVMASFVTDCLDADTGAVHAADAIVQSVQISIAPVVLHEGRITAFTAEQTVTRSGVAGSPCEGVYSVQSASLSGS